MKTVLKIVLAIVIAIVVLVAGCSVLVGGAIDSATKDAQKYSITKAEFRSVRQGTPMKVIVKRFGKPEDRQVMHTKGLHSVMIYYNVEGGSLGDQYQFSFDNGKLTGKAKY